MENIIEKLYNEDFRLKENSFYEYSEYAKASNILMEKADNFRGKLNKKDKKAFDEILDFQINLNEIDCREQFVKGFKLGGNIILSLKEKSKIFY